MLLTTPMAYRGVHACAKPNKRLSWDRKSAHWMVSWNAFASAISTVVVGRILLVLTYIPVKRGGDGLHDPRPFGAPMLGFEAYLGAEYLQRIVVDALRL